MIQVSYVAPGTKLSPHFTLAELTHTSRAALEDANAKEAAAYLSPLTALCTTLLEPVRTRFGPVSIHSGFRGPSLNAAVGGSGTSQHCKGEAADLHCPNANLVVVYEWIVASGLPFGQVILEGTDHKPTWIHLSLGPPWRDASRSGMALVYNGKDYRPFEKEKGRVA